MGNGDSRPVKQTFRNPVTLTSMALGYPPGRNLGHVHDETDTLFYCRLREERGGFEDAWNLNRIHEVGTSDPLECRAYRIKVRQISLGDFDFHTLRA